MIELPKHMSYSQVTTFLHCGEQYRLSRVLHLPEAPAWALVGGTAVHKASEVYDFAVLSGTTPPSVSDMFNEAFDAAIADDQEKAPEEYKDPSTWKTSGRASKAWPDKESEAWWRAHGPEFVGNWVNWRKNSPLEIWHNDDGEPAIELFATVEIAGYPVKVYIDRVMTGASGLHIIDLKAGANMPKDGLQLAIYSQAVKQTHDLDVDYGQFFDARHGLTSVSYATSAYPKTRLDYLFGSVRKQMEAGNFVPNVTNMCSACGVRRFCHSVNGERASEVKQPWED